MPDYIRKRMIVCTPFGEFVNGDVAGEMTAERLRAIAENFQKYPRQIPVYAMGDHSFDPDERLPDGWVEDVFVTASGALGVEAKILGTAASFVLDDLIRGASIGTVMGRNPDGSEQGEVLQHLLLTNAPFDKNVNIQLAAAQVTGGEPVAYFSTALPVEEPAMAKDAVKETPKSDPKAEELAALKAENLALKEKLEAGGDTDAKDREITRLKAENLELVEKLENATVDEEKHELALRVANLENKTLAQEVREIVFKMLKEGTIKPAKVDGYAKGGDEGTLGWFKASIFKGDLALLKFAAEHNPPVYRTGQKFTSGTPAPGEVTFTNEDREIIRKHGHDPDAVLAGLKARDFAEYKAQRANKEN